MRDDSKVRYNFVILVNIEIKVILSCNIFLYDFPKNS